MMANRLFRLGLIGLLLGLIIICSVVSAEDTSQKAPELLWKYKLGGVLNIAMSENPRYIAVGSYDGNVYIFGEEGNLLWKYLGSDGLFRVVLPSDGSVVAASVNNGDIVLMDKAGTSLWKKRLGDPTIGNHALAIDISSDGRFIAAGDDTSVYFLSRDGTLLWNYSIGKYVPSVAISDDGSYVAVGSGNQYVYLFNHDGTLLWKAQTPFPVYSVAISGKGESIAASLLANYWTYNNLCLFGNNGTLLWSTRGAPGAGGQIGITRDGQYIAMAGGGNATYLFDKNGTLLSENFVCNDLPEQWYPVHYIQQAKDVAISRDGNLIAIGCMGSDYLKLYRNQLPLNVPVNISGTSAPAGEISPVTPTVGILSPAMSLVPEPSPQGYVQQDPISGFICFIKKVFGGAC